MSVNVCTFQTLPALILKIMRGSVSPIADHYSDSLRQLIQDMLHLDPSKRPTIDEIMAQPFILDTLLSLYTDFGRIPCSRFHHLCHLLNDCSYSDTAHYSTLHCSILLNSVIHFISFIFYITFNIYT